MADAAVSDSISYTRKARFPAYIKKRSRQYADYYCVIAYNPDCYIKSYSQHILPQHYIPQYHFLIHSTKRDLPHEISFYQ